MTRLWMVVPATLLLIGSSAVAAPMGGAPASAISSFGFAGDHANGAHKQRAIYALLKKGKQIQIADGGTLTAAHHDQLQRELDTIRAGNY